MTGEPYLYVSRAEAYVDDVLSGRVPACLQIRQACERHRRDVSRIGDDDWPYTFDVDRAEKAAAFCARFPHVKGRWARKHELFDPEGWQCFFICSIFGWVNAETGLRRFRRARLYVPRKNGKSLLAAPIGLYMLTADGEPGAEVYSGATNEKQAWEVFGPAHRMTKNKPRFRERFGVTVNAKSLTVVDTFSKFEPVIGKPGDGSSPHCSITDEYHEHTTDEQLATMETGMGARAQPLSLIVSTAGDNISGPCRDDWLQCEKVLGQIFDDEELFALIYTIDKEDDWSSIEALKKANPNYGISVTEEFLVSQQKQAINNARKQGHFKIKHLNVWVQARDAYFNMEAWRSNRDELRLEDFEGMECIMALDLASKIDLVALELLFPLDAGRFVRFGKYYLPRATVDEPSNDHYRGWELEGAENEGWLTVTDGDMTDYFVILEDILALAKVFEIREVAYDPHNATMLVTALQNEGLELVEYGATVLNFSEPMKHLDGLIRSGLISHNGDPIMEWALSNVVAKVDRKDNVYPTKERNENKIDPAVALIMCVGRAIAASESGYDFSGFIHDAVVA